MGKFLRGLLLGMGLGLFIAPVRGREMRRMLGKRVRSLRTLFPYNKQLPHPIPQAQTPEAVPEKAHEVVVGTRSPAERTHSVASSPSTPMVQPDSTSAPSRVPAVPMMTPTQPSFAPFTPTSPSQADDTSPTLAMPRISVKGTGSVTIPSIQNTATPAHHPDLASNNEPDLDMTPTAPTQTVLEDTTQSPSVQTASKPAEETTLSSPVPANSKPAEEKSLATVPGVTAELLAQLHTLEVHTIAQLLERATHKDGRAELAQKVGISNNALRNITSRADLMQVASISTDDATLLQESNVINCKDLQHRNPEHLLTTLTETQARKRLGGRIPSLEQLHAWINEASTLTGHTPA